VLQKKTAPKVKAKPAVKLDGPLTRSWPA